jgi:hypothetical protein
MKREQKFKTEAALGAAFIAWATRHEGVQCYAEWWGWDILVVFPDGQQLGIQAKLRLNADVIGQASPSVYDFESNTQGPDFRGVLVPEVGRGNLFSVARLLGLIVFSSAPHGEFGPDLDGRSRTYGPWTDWNYPRRHDLPPTPTDAVAGSPCPVTLTPWKLAALEVLAELELRGTITTQQMKARGVDPRRWIAYSWLVPGEKRGDWVRGDRCPRFDEQHPTAYALALEKARKAAA